MKRLAKMVLLGLALAACDGGGDAEETNATGSTASASGSGGSGGGSGGSGGAGGAGGMSAGPCTAGNICFDVKKIAAGPITEGRVAVMWYQPNTEAPTPSPILPYDAPFDPAVTRVTIPIADITSPGEALLVCERACGDEYMCPCLSDPKVGYGIVLVAADTNQDQKIDPGEAIGYYGLGWMLLGYSAMAFMPAPPPFDANFVEGIEQGVYPYRIIDAGGGAHDVGLSQATDVFDLNLCTGPNTGCAPPLPNLN